MAWLDGPEESPRESSIAGLEEEEVLPGIIPTGTARFNSFPGSDLEVKLEGLGGIQVEVRGFKKSITRTVEYERSVPFQFSTVQPHFSSVNLNLHAKRILCNCFAEKRLIKKLRYLMTFS